MSHHSQAITVRLPSWYCLPISQALTTYLMHLTQQFNIAIRRSMRASSSKTPESYSSFKMNRLTILSHLPSPYLPPTPTSGRCQEWQLHMWQGEAKFWFTGKFDEYCDHCKLLVIICIYIWYHMQLWFLPPLCSWWCRRFLYWIFEAAVCVVKWQFDGLWRANLHRTV